LSIEEVSSGPRSAAEEKLPRGRLFVLALFGLLPAAFFPILLSRAAKLRPGTIHDYLWHLLPWASAHVLAFLLIRKYAGPRARIAIAFWALSAAAVLTVGGIASALVFLAILCFGLVVMGIGDGLARFLFEEGERNWGLSLGLGIAFTSVLGTYLAAAHLFTAWAIGSLLLLSLVIAQLRRRAGLLAGIRAGAAQVFSAQLSLSQGLALEGMFLFAVFAWVGASPPEVRSDAMRVYWPYVRLLGHFRGFFDLPFQWYFIVPQAGVTYAASLYVLFGSRCVRYAMLLALTALVAMVWSRVRGAGSSVSIAVALLVASCPLILGMTLSLMQDTFVSLATFLLALVCIEGRNPGSRAFWAAAGALAGLALAAKYTTVVYAGPLLAWAAWRSFRLERAARTLRGMVLGGGAALATAGPWLWHAYRQSGDPFFPFLIRISRPSLRPNGLGPFTLDRFHLAPGFRGWITWPFDVTFETNRFVEGLPGNLGIVVPVLLSLTVPLLFSRRHISSWPWILSAALGTVLLWTQTAYARYWLPGLWLLAPPAVSAALAFTKSAATRTAFGAAIPVVLLLQLPMEMNHSWSDSLGWPWEYYSGAIDDDGYYGRFPGYKALRRLDAVDPSWPRVWYTGIQQLGNSNVVPLQASDWEFHLHGAFSQTAVASYLDSAGCDYWIVNRNSPAANSFRILGVDKVFWNPGRAIAADRSVTIYRMPRAVARAPGSDLLRNGDFEIAEGGKPAAWAVNGAPRWIGASSAAKEGAAFVRLGPGDCLYQVVALPPGVHSFLLTEWVRRADPRSPSSFRLQVNWLDRMGRTLQPSLDVFRAEAEWAPFQKTETAPPEAVRGVVFLTNHDSASTTDFDDVHLYASRDP
jgi:hypothetical protein